jgi:hypothetical protein
MYAGPGAGKSSCAADLFSQMKWEGYNVELVDEFAKECPWDKNYSVLEDQLYVMAKQNRKLERLRGQVDFAITDSPIILAPLYAKPSYMPEYFKKLTHEVFESYDNLNIYLNRTKPFSPIGRHHTEEESRQKDQEILDMLSDYQYEYWCVNADRHTKDKILRILQEY